jgi:hypothetical protein
MLNVQEAEKIREHFVFLNPHSFWDTLYISIRTCLSIVLLSGENFKKHSEKENAYPHPTSDSTPTYTPLSSSSNTNSFCSSLSLSSAKFV